MSGFYVSLIFIGILLSIISLILILIDKKNIFVFRKAFDDKKQELVEIINDAEQMIDELNRFSDYIVSQIDVKNEELNANMKEAEKKLSALEERAVTIVDSMRTIDVKIQDHGVSDAVQNISANGYKEAVEPDIEKAADLELPSVAVNAPGRAAEVYSRNAGGTTGAVKRREKVIPFSNRYSEVLRLSNEGMGDLQIAKSLNMGKGEVELIIGLKR
jgi:hypothetical protein